jgi:CBS domain containing-hemolysin-like protein
MTEEEIRTCIKLGWDEGTITAEEKNMLSRVFTLNDKTVKQVMVPKDSMTFLDMHASTREILDIILKTGYTRFPVRKGSNSEIIGSIHAKDLFKVVSKKKRNPLKGIIRSPYFVSMEKTIDAQLRSFKARKLHQAIVLDSRGEVAGLITLEDILEELVGSIQDEHD